MAAYSRRRVQACLRGLLLAQFLSITPPVASLSVATDEAYTDKQGQRQERVDWHNVVVFGKAAERAVRNT